MTINFDELGAEGLNKLMHEQGLKMREVGRSLKEFVDYFDEIQRAGYRDPKIYDEICARAKKIQEAHMVYSIQGAPLQTHGAFLSGVLHSIAEVLDGGAEIVSAEKLQEDESARARVEGDSELLRSIQTQLNPIDDSMLN